MHFNKQASLELSNCILQCSAICVSTASCFYLLISSFFRTLFTAGLGIPDTDQILKKSDSLQGFSP